LVDDSLNESSEVDHEPENPAQLDIEAMLKEQRMVDTSAALQTVVESPLMDALSTKANAKETHQAIQARTQKRIEATETQTKTRQSFMARLSRVKILSGSRKKSRNSTSSLGDSGFPDNEDGDARPPGKRRSRWNKLIGTK
jgi:hypothetical protein